MAIIQNGFDFKDPCKTGVSYRVWTKEPRDLVGKCVATDITQVRSLGILGLADRNEGANSSYTLKADHLISEGVMRDYAQIIKDTIGFNPTGEGVKPLGCTLNPESFSIAKALYELTGVLTLMATTSKKSVTDLVIRDARFSPDEPDECGLRLLRKKYDLPYPFELVALQLTTDLYIR